MDGLQLNLIWKKAYDRINWEYLRKNLQNFGFDSKFIGWIMECVTTTTLSVLVNGDPQNLFTQQKDYGKEIRSLPIYSYYVQKH